MTGQNPFANDEEVEITADIDSATHTSFYVNGQKAFTAITGMSYLPSEIQTFGTIQQPFKTRGYKPYDPGTNSITIGVGSRFNLGNGYSMTVQEDFVWGEGYGNGSKADDERCNMIIGGLNTLIHRLYFRFSCVTGSGYKQRICDKRDTLRTGKWENK